MWATLGSTWGLKGLVYQSRERDGVVVGRWGSKTVKRRGEREENLVDGDGVREMEKQSG